MAAEQTTLTLGGRIYGLGVMAMAALCLVWGTFDPGQPVPRAFPDRTALACAAALFMLLAGAAIEWRRSVAWGAAALTAYYAFVVVLLMDGRVALAHYAEFGSYSNAAEQLAIAAGALVLYASHARIDATWAARLVRLGQRTFAVCALLFGAAHFVYLALTAPLVPQWLPPTQAFWAYATGLGQIAAGVAILTGKQARFAAILLTALYGTFAVLVWTPRLLAHPASHWIGAENALNLALVGVAWIVAESLTQPEP